MSLTFQHSGVLGMHWGQRRSRGGSLVTTKKPNTYSEDHQSMISLKKKKIHQMSNSELKAVSTRLQLTKSYKDLSKRDITEGEKIAKDILVGSVKTLAASYIIANAPAIGRKVVQYASTIIKTTN